MWSSCSNIPGLQNMYVGSPLSVCQIACLRKRSAMKFDTITSEWVGGESKGNEWNCSIRMDVFWGFLGRTKETDHVRDELSKTKLVPVGTISLLPGPGSGSAGGNRKNFVQCRESGNELQTKYSSDSSWTNSSSNNDNDQQDLTVIKSVPIYSNSQKEVLYFCSDWNGLSPVFIGNQPNTHNVDKTWL